MSEERLFKKKLVGGFDREDVIGYIDELLSEIKKMREESERKDLRITELEKRIDEFEAACAAAPEPIELDKPEQVLSHVDKILQTYLGREAED